MVKIKGIVSSRSYLLNLKNNYYLVEFSLQVDKKINIEGEIHISYKSKDLIEFLPGDKIEILYYPSKRKNYFLEVIKIHKISHFQ